MSSVIRCAVFVRTSTAEQRPDLQLDEILQVARQRGYEIVAQYVEIGSGAGKHLPERERLLCDARDGKLDLVMVWRLDRLGRSLRDLLEIVESFKRWGVAFVSVRDHVDTATPAGQLVFAIFGALAEFERSLILERVQAGLSAAKRRGTRMGRPRREFDRERAKRLLATGCPLKTVARTVGVPPRTLRGVVPIPVEN